MNTREASALMSSFSPQGHSFTATNWHIPTAARKLKNLASRDLVVRKAFSNSRRSIGRLLDRPARPTLTSSVLYSKNDSFLFFNFISSIFPLRNVATVTFYSNFKSHTTMYSPIQCSIIQYSNTQRSIIQCSLIQCSLI